MHKWMSLAVVVPIVWCSSAFASKAYDDGVAEAKADLDKGYAYVLSYGLREFDCDDVAWSVGLPIKWIAGCLVDNDIEDRAAGYNETVRAWAKEHGKQPANSIKPWEKQLKDVVAYFRASGEAKPVRIGAEPVRFLGDADAKHMASITAPNEKGEQFLVMQTDAGEVRRQLSATSARGVWAKAGPKDSMTVVLRMPNGDGKDYYELVELRRGATLLDKTASKKET
jgi:hypothetical protein